jgi:ApeA N-terminal domain 1
MARQDPTACPRRPNHLGYYSRHVTKACDFVVVVRICPVPFSEVAMETLEVAGLWWMPTRPDHKVPGTLTFDLRKAGRLKLIGGLRTPLDRAEDFTDASTYGRLHGECEGHPFTLEGCFQRSLRGAPSAPYGEVIYVNNVYEDVWFSADERAEGDGLNFDVDGLTEWVARSGLVQTFCDSPADGEPWVKLEGVSLPKREAGLPGTGTVTIEQKLSTKGRDTSLSLTESYSFKLAYDSNVPVLDLLDTLTISKISSPLQRTKVRSSDS